MKTTQCFDTPMLRDAYRTIRSKAVSVRGITKTQFDNRVKFIVQGTKPIDFVEAAELVYLEEVEREGFDLQPSREFQ